MKGARFDQIGELEPEKKPEVDPRDSVVVMKDGTVIPREQYDISLITLADGKQMTFKEFDAANVVKVEEAEVVWRKKLEDPKAVESLTRAKQLVTDLLIINEQELKLADRHGEILGIVESVYGLGSGISDVVPLKDDPFMLGDASVFDKMPRDERSFSKERHALVKRSLALKLALENISTLLSGKLGEPATGADGPFTD
jgi:hypothetical protein